MQSPEHTPGPWAIIVREGHPRITTDADKPWLIAEVHVDSDPKIDDSMANAHLIAAAPELLAALESYGLRHKFRCEKGNRIDREDCSCSCGADAALRAATEKAKGDQ